MEGIRIMLSGCLQKIGQDARANDTRSFGVELGATEVAAARDGGERAAVFRGGDGPLARGHGVTMHEVHVVERTHPLEQRIRLALAELIPAHVWHGQAGRELEPL